MHSVTRTQNFQNVHPVDTGTIRLKIIEEVDKTIQSRNQMKPAKRVGLAPSKKLCDDHVGGEQWGR
jgi:hypothetical protein